MPELEPVTRTLLLLRSSINHIFPYCTFSNRTGLINFWFGRFCFSIRFKNQQQRIPRLDADIQSARLVAMCKFVALAGIRIPDPGRFAGGIEIRAERYGGGVIGIGKKEYIPAFGKVMDKKKLITRRRNPDGWQYADFFHHIGCPGQQIILVFVRGRNEQNPVRVDFLDMAHRKLDGNTSLKEVF